MNVRFPKSKQEQLIQQMEENLYLLYRSIAKVAAGVEDSTGNLQSVNIPHLSWPRTIFDRPSENVDFAQLTTRIKEGKLPPFWIMCRRANEELHHRLLEHGFRHMAQWPGMILPLEKRTKPQIEEAIEIKQLSRAAELKEWLDLVNENLMKTSPLDVSIFQKCWKEMSNLQFYGLKLEGKMVSTGLAHLHEGTLGLYMLSTAKPSRRRGYTTLLLQYILAEAWKNGVGIAVLQASADGQWVYPKLGFQTICHFDIYWLLGYR